MSLFYTKYLKYKNKYFSLKNQFGGAKGAEEIPCQKWSAAAECRCPKCAQERYIPKYKPSDKISFEMLDRDTITKIATTFGYDSLVNFLTTNNSIARQINYSLLNSILNKKYNFKQIESKLAQQRISLLDTVAKEFKDIANLYVGKIRLIKLYNMLVKNTGEVIFDNNLILNLLVRTIPVNRNTNEATVRSNQNFLTFLLPPEMVLKNISNKTYWDYIPEDIKSYRESEDDYLIEDLQIIIPNSVEVIEDHAFHNMNLGYVIPLGNGKFSYYSVTIPKNVRYIGDYAFSENSLREIIIPDSVTHIGKYAFWRSGITKLYISKSISKIENGSFSNNHLTEVTIPNSVISIGDMAFDNNNLKKINIPPSVKSIGEAAFGYNPLIEVTIPNTVTSIGRKAFAVTSSVKKSHPPLSKDGFPDKFKDADIF